MSWPQLTLSLADLDRFYAIADEESGEKNNYSMSVASLMETVRQEMPKTEIGTLQEARNLLRALSFKFGNLHTDHYFKIGNRQDVRHHRDDFAPFYHGLLTSTKVFVVCADASFFHENAHSKCAWFPLDKEGRDMVPAKVGTGQRLNVWEFVTAEGLLPHPDGPFFSAPHPTFIASSDHLLGASAGTIFPPNTTQDADDIVGAIKRGIEAIEADPRSQNRIPVLLIDGARVNKTMPPDSINPNNVLSRECHFKSILLILKNFLSPLRFAVSDRNHR